MTDGRFAAKLRPGGIRPPLSGRVLRKDQILYRDFGGARARDRVERRNKLLRHGVGKRYFVYDIGKHAVAGANKR